MIEQIRLFIHKFKFNREEFDRAKLKFRLSLLKEEFEETITAYNNNDGEELVDGLVDIVVIALGTLELAGVNSYQAWNEVMRANMAKERGIKPGRESSGGYDVIKPKGWVAPSHKGNHGVLDEILKP